MSADLLKRAQAGDEAAFAELVAPHRRELHVHAYRILGSVQDAEDLLQETLLAAWRGLDQFEQRSSLRAWLYRIATNRCLNALRDSGRRPQEVPMRLDELPKSREVIAYCRGPFCVMAHEAVHRLRSAGRSARRLEEGWPEWHLRELEEAGKR